MSFSGDLEHLSIIDVIQLLHTTRKSGMLRVQGRRGESQLVFKDGYIVGASHLNNSVRIGTILVDSNVITPDILDQALHEQKNAGDDRKPLIVTLIEKGLVKEEEAYKGLEHLIEMTIVEILTWKKGTFMLEVVHPSVSDDYRYYLDKTSREINIDTQSVLMDALRIYDEKMRDGELTEEEFPEDEAAAEGAVTGDVDSLVSADDLGLEDLDRLERIIPEVFSSLEDRNPSSSQRRKVEEIGADLSAQEQEELLSFLQQFSGPARAGEAPAPSVILFSSDELLTYCITTVCKHEGIHVFATNEQEDLEHIIAQFLSRQVLPFLVFDRPGKPAGIPEANLAPLRQQILQQHPRICTIQLASPLDYAFALQSFHDGVRAVIPSPSLEERKGSFVGDTKIFLNAFLSYLRGSLPGAGNQLVGTLRRSISALRELKEAPEVAFSLLQFVAEIFERSLTMVVRETELIAEKSIGVKEEQGREATPPLGFRIPLSAPSLFRTVIEEGRMFFGASNDEVVRQHLFTAIGAPSRSTFLLLPLRSFGKTIAITYGDFGSNESAPVPVDLLEILASQAGLVLENSSYRKKQEKSAE